VIWFRSVDRRWSFLWEDASQPAARWHDTGEGPVHYLAETPDGAWAEFLRHEEIDDPAELAGVRRNLWAVEVRDDEPFERADLPDDTVRGGLETYAACCAESQSLRARGASALQAPSAALVGGGARGQHVLGGLAEAEDRDGHVLVLFGLRPDLRGWLCAEGRPSDRLVALVRPLAPARQ
jgi:RES domain